MKDKEPKMAQYLDRLTYVEQAIICRMVREHSGEQRYAHLHPGLLPFIPVEVVRIALLYSKGVRPVAVIIAKLQLNPSGVFTDDHILLLSDRKVFKVFGRAPETGRQFTWLPGRPVVAVSKVRDGWKVSVVEKYKGAVLCWLADNCRKEANATT